MIASFSKPLVTLKTALIVDSHTHRILAVRLGGDTYYIYNGWYNYNGVRQSSPKLTLSLVLNRFGGVNFVPHIFYSYKISEDKEAGNSTVVFTVQVQL